jgi:hypothetical protein
MTSIPTFIYNFLETEKIFTQINEVVVTARERRTPEKRRQELKTRLRFAAEEI